MGHWSRFAVSDTGIGIPPDQLDKVFDRFYQVDASQTREQEGSGIGLALVKELVELHHGTIQVRVKSDKGRRSRFDFPLGRSHLKDDEIVEQPMTVTSRRRVKRMTPAVDKAGGGAPGRNRIRNKPEVRSPSFLSLKTMQMFVHTSRNTWFLPIKYRRRGTERKGIEKAQEIVPDLIISDVMMPKKDGYEVCRILKKDEKTSHIPIILLTAKAASENRIEGLEIGADDYLIKPFEPKELLARVKNLIELRRKLRERFSASAPLRPGRDRCHLNGRCLPEESRAVVEQRWPMRISALRSLARRLV